MKSVHHIDGDSYNNDPSNLVTFGSDAPIAEKPKRTVGRPEDDHMRYHCIPHWRAGGFQEFVTSTRVKPRGVTPGVADLILFNAFLGIEVAHEVKLKGDRQSQGQLAYQEQCIAVHKAYVLGDDEAVGDFLVWMGVAYREPHTFQGQRLVIRRQSDWKGTAGSAHERDVIRERVGAWNFTPLARAHQDRFGWKATPGAIRKLTR